jgi:GDP-4-dehydro-6-deoxy-D-mannose reductase
LAPRILITGVGGFGGGFLARESLARGAEVFGLSRGGMAPEGVTPIHGDLLEPESAMRAVEVAAPTHVFHLAAQTPGNTPGNDDRSWVTINPLMTLHLLEALRRHAPAARILIVSSSAVYGHVPEDQLPIAEESPLQPTTMYGVSKATQELIAIRYAAEFGMPVVRVRPFNQVGPGEPPAMLASMLARQVAQIAAGAAPPVVRMRHRATRRDFTDVRDTARAYWAAIDNGAPGAVYNVCSGVPTPIGAIAERLLAIAGVDATIETTGGAPAPNDILVQCGSYRRLAAISGWQPQIDLDTSLADLLRTLQE